MSRSFVFACALIVLSAARGFAVESLPAAAATTLDAPKLVESALQASLAGDASQRDELLTKALVADPRYAPAQWQSGRVLFDSQWRSVEEVRDILAADSRWQDYAQLKATLAGTPADHEQLARWCLRQGLEKEERFHWRNVLQANPKHEFAKSRLGVSEYLGGLYTKEQIAADQEQIKQVEHNFAKLAPGLLQTCERAMADDLATRAAALEELSKTTDIAALEALEYAVDQTCQTAAPERALDLNLALVAALSNMPDHKATMRLLDYSVFAELPDIRHAAARALKPRPVTDYVPRLLASLTGHIKSEVGAFVANNGTVVVAENLYQPGQDVDLRVIRSQDFTVNAVPNERGERYLGAARREIFRNKQRASAIAYYARRRAEAANLEIAARNERIREVLRNTLDLDLGADPQRYWDEWTSYNEYYEPEQPIYYYEEYYSYFVTFSAPPIPPPPGKYSCFAAGTPVWTQAGFKPIERIAVGEMVLAQNPTTGELDFRPVLRTTIRPPGPMVRLAVGSDLIDATLGHRFWVSGKGWEMAKQLPPRAVLHAIDGSMPLDKVQQLADGDAVEAYNLVVDDFHTYFVGESRLLVHDNSNPQPTTALLPGLNSSATLTNAGILGNVAP